MTRTTTAIALSLFATAALATPLYAAAAPAPRPLHAAPNAAIAGARAVRTTPDYFDLMGWGTRRLDACYPGEPGLTAPYRPVTIQRYAYGGVVGTPSAAYYGPSKIAYVVTTYATPAQARAMEAWMVDHVCGNGQDPLFSVSTVPGEHLFADFDWYKSPGDTPYTLFVYGAHVVTTQVTAVGDQYGGYRGGLLVKNVDDQIAAQLGYRNHGCLTEGPTLRNVANWAVNDATGLGGLGSGDRVDLAEAQAYADGVFAQCVAQDKALRGTGRVARDEKTAADENAIAAKVIAVALNLPLERSLGMDTSTAATVTRLTNAITTEQRGEAALQDAAAAMDQPRGTILGL